MKSKRAKRRRSMTDDPRIGEAFRHVHTPWLVECARQFAWGCRAEAAKQDAGLSGDSGRNQRDPFAAIGVEAFFNELPAETEALARRDPVLARLRDAPIQAEEERARVELKFIVACMATGRAADRGAEPFQGLDLLVDLRNAIAHVRSYEHTFAEDGRVDSEPRKLLARLFTRGLIADAGRHPVEMFMSVVGTPEAAEWSVATAQATIDYVIEGLQHEHSRELCCFHFSPMLFGKLASDRAARTERAGARPDARRKRPTR
jgi:hypothetical protein